MLYKGRYGPYVSRDGINATVPRDLVPEELTVDQALDLFWPPRRRAANRRGEAAVDAEAPRKPARPRPRPKRRSRRKPPRRSKRPNERCLNGTAQAAEKSARKFRDRPKRPKDYAPKRQIVDAGGLPEIGVLEITGVDFDGEITARPVDWDRDAPPPSIIVAVERGSPAPTSGERAVARFARQPDGTYEARIIRILAAAPDRIVGIFRADKEGGRIEPTDRKIKNDFRVAKLDSKNAEDGEIVLAEPLSGRRLGLPQAKILERIGRSDEPRAFSLIAIHSAGIPTVFPPAASPSRRQRNPSRSAVAPICAPCRSSPSTARTRATSTTRFSPSPIPSWTAAGTSSSPSPTSPVCATGRRARQSGARARQFRLFPRPRRADVARGAVERTLFAEARCRTRLSRGPSLDRPRRQSHRHRFVRGLMRSAARLTYEQVQAALDGNPNEVTATLLDPVIRPLHRAYQSLDKARRRRGTLDLDLPERKCALGYDGTYRADRAAAAL